MRNEISDKDIDQLQEVAAHYMQEVVVKEVTPTIFKDGVGEMMNEIRALSEDDKEDNDV